MQVFDIGQDTCWLCIMSDGVWENVQSVTFSNYIMQCHGLQDGAKKIVEEAKRVIHAGKRYRDDMTAVVVQFHNYGRPEGPRSRKMSGNADEGPVEEVELTDDEMVFQAVAVCREAIGQGVHVEDVLDLLVGMTDELKTRVKAELDKPEYDESAKAPASFLFANSERHSKPQELV